MKIKICPQCKTENRAVANFCKQCRLDLTSVISKKKVADDFSQRISFPKIIAGTLIIAGVVFGVWYLLTNITADKAKKAVREMIALEKEISSLDNEITKKYSVAEIEQAKRFLQEAKKSLDRNDHASAVEWLNQAENNIKLAKEKDSSGREKDYELFMNKGQDNTQKGLWDEAITAYQEALKYNAGDNKAGNEIKYAQKKKQEAEENKREEDAMLREEERKQKIAQHIARGRQYISNEKYNQAIEEFEKAITLGATGEVERLLAETKKKYGNMVLIPAGEFTMGSDSGESDEKPPHRVYLDAYWIDKYEVTFEQYDKFCEATGRSKPSDSGWGRGNRPVINVSWNDAVSYAKWAGKRLPTEAEWEKACRAGSTSKYCYGNSESMLGDYAWYSSNSGSKTHPVGQKKPNAWGIYDMHGNVWEWCSDWYDSGYYKVAAGFQPAKNPKGPNSGSVRVLRGGSWDFDAYNCRSSFRGWNTPDLRYFIGGFRCAASGAQ